MKQFLSYTAIIEGLTGLALLLFPSLVVELLLNLSLRTPLEGMLSIIAGVAICTIALASWLFKSTIHNLVFVKILLFYNLVISCLLVYGTLKFNLSTIPLWIVILFHILQSFVAVILISKKKTN